MIKSEDTPLEDKVVETARYVKREDLKNTVIRVEEIHGWMQGFNDQLLFLPRINEMLMTVSTAQATMARSAESMADTFRMAEKRYERMEQRYDAMTGVVAGKEQIPLKSHYWIQAASLIPTIVMAMGIVIAVLWYTKTNINATLTSIQVKQEEALHNQEIVKKQLELKEEKESQQ